MKTFTVKIKNHYVTSVEEKIIADSEVSAKQKARKVFCFKGDDKYIKILSVQ